MMPYAKKTRMTFLRFFYYFWLINNNGRYYHSDELGLRSPGIQGMVYNQNVLHTVVTPIEACVVYRLHARALRSRQPVEYWTFEA